ncbi:hypothetical protein HAX54_013084 [Datura stramonium]|uniref:Uncharacterized protein n=1 Tax=Datura stramonium TaxID=4076 RepID=A0ABS8RY54_DATST|nr:hypothetical protein [Datura stramonium]
MSLIKPSSRYAKTSFDSSRSSTKSGPFFLQTSTPKTHNTALIKIKKGSNGVAPTTHQSNFSSMVKKFVEHKSASSKLLKQQQQQKKGDLKLVIPADFIAEDLKKTAKRGSGLSAFHKKLFKGSSSVARKKRKEARRREQEDQIVELKLMLEEKNQEDLLEKQGSELKQAKQLIPNLQRQVKADKYAIRGSYDSLGSPPDKDQEAANSLEFSSEDHTIPGSPDDMFLKDVNPCLRPYYKTVQGIRGLQFS